MPSRSFGDLPNELIHEIFEYVDLSRPRHQRTDQEGEDVFYALARLNKRIQPIALVFARRHREFATSDEFKAFEYQMELWDSGKRYDDIGKHDNFTVTRSISIGRVEYPHRQQDFEREFDKFSFCADYFIWPNLTSFECLDSVTTPRYNFDYLTGCRKLRNLVLLWRCNLLCPDLDEFPSLETLRLYLVDVDKSSPPRPPSPLNIHPKLHTLAIHEISRYQAIELCCRGFTLPNLRVLRLTDIESEAPVIYDFVRRHPSLLEVNLRFSDSWEGQSALLFEPILKLIDGTGTWLPDAASSTGLVDQATVKQLLHADARPSLSIDMLAPLYEFAFSRAPLPPVASSAGSSDPRYCCTAFAVNWHWGNAREVIPGNFADAIDFIHNPPLPREHFWSEVHQLRIASYLTEERQLDFSVYIHTLADKLSTHFPKLRCLALFLDHDKWVWRHPDYNDPTLPPLSLDNVCPNAFDYCSTVPITLFEQRFIYPHDDPERLEKAIREIFQLPQHAKLDLHDPNLLLTAWGVKNRPIISEGMKTLASVHKTLEQVEWYSGQDDRQYGVIRWAWTISRNADGTVRDLVDDLAWTGCPKGNPPVPLTLVGRELEYVLKDAEGLWDVRGGGTGDGSECLNCDDDDDAFASGSDEF